MECIEPEIRDNSARPALSARLRKSNGFNCDIAVLDVSLAGCMFDRHGLALQVGERVLIRMADLSLMPGEIVWIEEQEVGLVFETELYEPVLAHLKRLFRPR